MLRQIRFGHVGLTKEGVRPVSPARILELIECYIDPIAPVDIGLGLAREVSVFTESAGLSVVQLRLVRWRALRGPSCNGRRQNPLGEAGQREEHQGSKRQP